MSSAPIEKNEFEQLRTDDLVSGLISGLISGLVIGRPKSVPEHKVRSFAEDHELKETELSLAVESTSFSGSTESEMESGCAPGRPHISSESSADLSSANTSSELSDGSTGSQVLPESSAASSGAYKLSEPFATSTGVHEVVPLISSFKFDELESRPSISVVDDTVIEHWKVQEGIQIEEGPTHVSMANLQDRKTSLPISEEQVVQSDNKNLDDLSLDGAHRKLSVKIKDFQMDNVLSQPQRVEGILGATLGLEETNIQLDESSASNIRGLGGDFMPLELSGVMEDEVMNKSADDSFKNIGNLKVDGSLFLHQSESSDSITVVNPQSSSVSNPIDHKTLGTSNEQEAHIVASDSVCRIDQSDTHSLLSGSVELEGEENSVHVNERNFQPSRNNICVFTQNLVNVEAIGKVESSEVETDFHLESQGINDTGTDFGVSVVHNSSAETIFEQAVDICTDCTSLRYDTSASVVNAESDLATVESRTADLSPEVGQPESQSIEKVSPLSVTMEVKQDIQVCDTSALSSHDEAFNNIESSRMEGSTSHGFEVSISSSSELEAKEGKEFENVSREFSLDSQAVKACEQEGLSAEALAHVVKRASYLILQLASINTNAGSDFELKPFAEDDEGSIDFVHFIQDYDLWMDEMQKMLEERKNVEAISTNLENELLSKTSEVNTLLEKIEKLSQDCAGLQGQLDEEMEKSKLLENLVSIKDTDIERLSLTVSEMSQKCDELQESSDEKEQLRNVTQMLEDLISSKDADIERLSSELSHKCLDLQAVDENDRQLRNEIKALEDSLAAKDQDLKRLADKITELSCKCDGLQNELDEQQQLRSKTLSLEDSLLAKDTEIERLSDIISQLSHECNLAKEGMVKVEEERSSIESTLKHLEHLLAEKEMERALLSDKVQDVSGKHDLTKVELAKVGDEKDNLTHELKQLHEQLMSKGTDLDKVYDRISALSEEVNLVSVERAQVLEEKLSLENELHRFQNVHIEQENKVRQLESVLFEKDSEVEVLQKLYAEAKESYLHLHTQISSLADKMTSDLNLWSDAADGNAISALENTITYLDNQYKAILKEKSELLLRISEIDASHEMLMQDLREQLSAKERELECAQEKLDTLIKDLNQTKEEGERRLLEAEQKALGVRERLSLAVTKGKGLIQQRDNLKQLLAEKTAEMEAMASSYQQEIHAKTIALNEAEQKAKLNLEAGERVEALESELSYIRNSANALRESFLQKDAALQKIEELLEDAGLPEEFQMKDTCEKVEWLIESTSQKNMASDEMASERVGTRDLDFFSTAGQKSQMQEVEELNKKCDELGRKYRSMAEQSAMLEQSLLERNMLIQKWEEMLDIVEMPSSVRTKEPEDKIQWLGMELSNALDSVVHLQAEIDSLQTAVQTSNESLLKLQEENSVISAELIRKEEMLQMVTSEMEAVNMKFNSLSEITPQSNNTDRSYVKERDFEMSAAGEGENQKQQFQIEDLDALMSEIRVSLSEVLQENEVESVFSGVSMSMAFKDALKLIVEKSKVWLAESRQIEDKLSKLTLAMENEHENAGKEIQVLHEALSLKTIEVENTNIQLETFAAKIASLENEVAQLHKELEAKNEEVFSLKEELNKSVTLGEERLVSVREKLSMAVKKGKSVVQQRDALKQSLEEQSAELAQLRKDYEAESLTLSKAKQSFKNQVQHLEEELRSSRMHVTSLEKSIQEDKNLIKRLEEALDEMLTLGSSRPRDVMEKLQLISQVMLDLQRKAGINEQEARKAKSAAELLALELEETHGRMESLAEELMHTEKNVSILSEEKKLAEASKAEAGLRLEHAMASVNSLLFELRESKDAQTNLEQENSSLKDSLAAQVEEIRSKHTELAELNIKVHALKDHQSQFFVQLVDELPKLSEGLREMKDQTLKICGDLKEYDVIALLNAPTILERLPLKWELEYSDKGETAQEWKQGVTNGSALSLCEEMEAGFQHFVMYFNNHLCALNQDFVTISQLLSEICNGFSSVVKELAVSKRNADVALSAESLLLQKDQQITRSEELFKEIAEKIKSSLEEIEGLDSMLQIPGLSLDTRLPSITSGSLSGQAYYLVDELSSFTKDLARSCQHIHIESQREIEELQSQLGEAKKVIDAMGQQQQVHKLKLQRCLEELDGKDEILKRTNQDLFSLRDALTVKGHEEKGLLEALEKSEAKAGELSAKVVELEKVKEELEAALGKASSRFHATVNNFNKFQSVSEKLIEEAESLHLLLEDRDAQLSLLKDEVADKADKINELQELVNERTADLSRVYEQIGGIINKDASGGDVLSDTERRKQILEELAASVRAGTEGLRVQLARKDALLQDMQLRHDDMVRKVQVLESTIQENQRLTEQRGAAEHLMISAETEEKVRGKLVTSSVSHGRGGRKVSATDHIVLDVNAETERLLADVDDEDKGHSFKPLTSSRLVPRGSRILVDRLDSFWVSGERLLRRKPSARLSVIVYWFALHIWIAAMLL
ncbi:hypothetical protein KP509_15G031700 [Ceratopteris richardii]|nr:hypothetical protein KP509_15G031700 [Ceratopteris richardii]